MHSIGTLFVMPCLIVLCAAMGHRDCNAADTSLFNQEASIYVKDFSVCAKACVKRSDTEHPVFHGCIDWHSSVHGYWAILRSYRYLHDPALLEIVRTAFDRNMMRTEYDYLKKNKRFEMPYGRSWFLLLISEYEKATRSEEFRYFADYVADSLFDYLSKKEFDPGTDDYDNQSWAYSQLIMYWEHTHNKKVLIVKNMLHDKLIYSINIDNDAKPHFFSAWGNYAHLLTKILTRDEFNEWLKTQNINADRIRPIGDLVSDHHLAINFSRAWAFWSVYDKTHNELFLTAYRQALKSGWNNHKKYKNDYYKYGHWVSQFGIYATTIQDFPENSVK